MPHLFIDNMEQLYVLLKVKVKKSMNKKLCPSKNNNRPNSHCYLNNFVCVLTNATL